jgi:type I restriction enzyme S subunit
MATDLQGSWSTTRLGEAVDQLAGFAFKSHQYVESGEGIRLLRGDNIAPGSLRWNGCRDYPSELVSELDQYQLRNGDVVIAMDRPWIVAGLKVARIRQEDLPALLVQRVTRLRAREDIDGDFIWACVRSPTFITYLRAETTGTAVPHISGKQIGSFRLELPPVAEQRAIASVIETLDDKIESNRRLGNAIWNVITEEFRRACPIVGGGGATLSDLATVVMGQAPPGSSYIDAPAEGALPMIQGNGGFGVHFVEPTVWTTAPTKVVAPGTPLMTVRAPVGSVNQAASEICLGRGVAGLVSTRPVLVECLLRELQRVDGWVAHESGTIYPSVNRNQIAGLPIGSLPEAKAETFEEWATPMAGEVRVLERESHTLVAIRDALLPKLVSGQIRVPLSDDPEEQLGAAAEGLEIAEGAA